MLYTSRKSEQQLVGRPAHNTIFLLNAIKHTAAHLSGLGARATANTARKDIRITREIERERESKREKERERE